MTGDQPPTPTLRSDPPASEQDVPSVSLHDAAELLGISDAEMLMRVFRHSIPSVVAGDGTRRVPLPALDAALENAQAEPASPPPDAAVAPAELEALSAVLHDVRSRLGALEAAPRQPPTPPAALEGLAGELERVRTRIAALEGLAAELEGVRTRVAALEALAERQPLGWRELWEQCSRLLSSRLRAAARR